VITSIRRYESPSCLASSMAFAMAHLQRSVMTGCVADRSSYGEVGGSYRLQLSGSPDCRRGALRPGYRPVEFATFPHCVATRHVGKATAEGVT
jgi:hypothetical protein